MKTHSPVIGKPNKVPFQMDFYKALALIVKGEKMYRLEWAGKNEYIFMDGAYLKLHKKDGTVHNLIVTDGDILGTDWIALNKSSPSVGEA